jgi:hypothetical protein
MTSDGARSIWTVFTATVVAAFAPSLVGCASVVPRAPVAANTTMPAPDTAVVTVAAVPVDSKILFARDSTIPRPVQEFAWRVIETRCNYQRYEREQRSFSAYNAQATQVDGGVAYSIAILSDLPWKQTEPPALIEMTIVDDGRLRLTALKSSFVNCEFSPTPRN